MDPEKDPARCRLSHHSVKDCHWLRRRVRQRLAQRQPGTAGIPAGTLYGLYIRCHRRRIRLYRRHLAAGRVHAGHSRGFMIAAAAQDTFSRLLAGSISFTFFFYVFVNTAMVTGLLPVVGVPLPLVSAGGTSMVTLMAGSVSSCPYKLIESCCHDETEFVACTARPGSADLSSCRPARPEPGLTP